MRSDQRQPGWKVQRPISPPASLTNSTVVLFGVRVSSGESNPRASTPGISGLLPGGSLTHPLNFEARSTARPSGQRSETGPLDRHRHDRSTRRSAMPPREACSELGDLERFFFDEATTASRLHKIRSTPNEVHDLLILMPGCRRGWSCSRRGGHALWRAR